MKKKRARNLTNSIKEIHPLRYEYLLAIGCAYYILKATKYMYGSKNSELK